MSGYCGRCRNGAECPEHPHAGEQRRSDCGGERIVAVVAVLFVLLVVVPVVWQWVELAASAP